MLSWIAGKVRCAQINFDGYAVYRDLDDKFAFTVTASTAVSCVATYRFLQPKLNLL